MEADRPDVCYFDLKVVKRPWLPSRNIQFVNIPLSFFPVSEYSSDSLVSFITILSHSLFTRTYVRIRIDDPLNGHILSVEAMPNYSPRPDSLRVLVEPGINFDEPIEENNPFRWGPSF